jgi:hypothetical protein
MAFAADTYPTVPDFSLLRAQRTLGWMGKSMAEGQALLRTEGWCYKSRASRLE